MIKNGKEEQGEVERLLKTHLGSLTGKYGFSFHVVDMREINRKVHTRELTLSSLLSDKELQYLLGLKNKKNYIQWISGRYAVKSAFFKYKYEEQSVMDLKCVDVLRGEDSAPYILQHPDICVSITHSFPYCIGVVSNRKIGIDIEKVFNPKDALIKRYFSEGEREHLESLLGTEEYSKKATILWTRKEAVSKVLKLGMNMDFKTVDVLIDEICSIGEDKEAISMSSFTCNDFCLSVAVGRCCNLKV
ncbi:MAG: 4'-phosphopantetheinyl transferase superfamily protein [Clostridium sp.]|jgi:phosphopantetheinyl transferase|nr:4'-phosphopantetheinyl transferase superfamily protein [Clostridium sp.]